MKRQAWIDHKFNLNIDLGWTDNVKIRLENTAVLLTHYAKNLNDEQLSLSINNSWSIKEHIGHLTDLESLWGNRLLQFEQELPELLAADMSNKKTKKANHNEQPLQKLLQDFNNARKHVLDIFNNLSNRALEHKTMHPRIKEFMHPVDLLFFIAEHDDHHLVSISKIKNSF